MSKPVPDLYNLSDAEEEQSDDESTDEVANGKVVKPRPPDDDDDADDDADDGADDDEISVDAESIAGSDDEPDISSSQNVYNTQLQNEIGIGVNEYGDDDDDDGDDDDDDEHYLQKFDDQLHKNIIQEYHPELIIHSNDDIQAYTRIVKNEKGQIIDPLHTTLPFVTKYERARILGERAKQLNAGAKALTDVDSDVIDGYLIAIKEFEEKKIPFIVKRPMPNGGCEYWKLKDLEIIG